jgi:drug/metabolite transporter (DMT)-like permease
MDLRKKAQIAWGMFVICLLFLLETWNADRIAPNPASPLVWALLGTVAVVCLALALWLGHRARRTESASQ